MRSLVALYVQQFRITLASMVQYRVTLAIWMISHVLEPLVYLVVWSTVSETGGGSVGDYTTREFAAYFIVLMLVNYFTFTWIMYEFECRVREGTFSVALLKPVHPIHSDVADNISFKVITLPLIIIIAVGLGALFHPVVDPPWWAVVVAIPVVVLGFVDRFLLEWTLAQSAFWTTRVGAVNQIYFVLLLFLSGQVAPLALFPAPVRILAAILPFRWMIGFPVELLLGRLSPVQVLTGLGAQLAWLLAGYALLRIVWRSGIRNYSAVGA